MRLSDGLVAASASTPGLCRLLLNRKVLHAAAQAAGPQGRYQRRPLRLAQPSAQCVSAQSDVRQVVIEQTSGRALDCASAADGWTCE